MTKPIDLTIKTKYDKPDKVIEIHPNLPIHPSYSIVIGDGNSGKTLMLINLLHKLKSITKHNIVIFSETINGTLEKVCEDLNASLFDSLYDDNGTNRIEAIMKYQNSQRRLGFKVRPIYLIFDDFIDNQVFNSRRSCVASLFKRGRHCNISVFLTSQYYKDVPKNIRALAHYRFLFNPHDDDALQDIADENRLTLSKESFVRLFKEHTKERYSFIIVDKKKGRLLRNFTDIIFEAD